MIVVTSLIFICFLKIFLSSFFSAVMERNHFYCTLVPVAALYRTCSLATTRLYSCLVTTSCRHQRGPQSLEYETSQFLTQTLTSDAKFGLKKLEQPFCGRVQGIFRYLEPFKRDQRVCMTDGQTVS